MTRYVLIGTGVASISAAEAIRSQDQAAEIIFIGSDPHGYYSRPGLAYYLTGEIPSDQLFPRASLFRNQQQVRWIQGQVTRIFPNTHQVEIDRKQLLSYSKLLIAVGAEANLLKVPGSELDGVFKIDDYEDAHLLVSRARKAKNAIVVGGGITALELAEGLQARNVRVRYFLRGDRYWNNVLDEVESRIVERRLHDHGIKIHYRTEIGEILGKRGKVNAVRTADGREFHCDILAFAIGIRPRISLAQTSDISTDRGILVDEFMRTNQADIFAAGDVAQVFDPLSGTSILDSLWNPAREQGYTAGLNMAGKTIPYHKSIPFNVTRLAGLTTTIIGTVGQGRDSDLQGIARGDSETWRQLPDAIIAQTGFDVNRLRLVLGEKSILGAVVMGDQTLSRPLQKLILSKADISAIRTQLLEPDAPLADLIADFWVEWCRRNEN